MAEIERVSPMSLLEVCICIGATTMCHVSHVTWHMSNFTETEKTGVALGQENIKSRNEVPSVDFIILQDEHVQGSSS